MSTEDGKLLAAFAAYWRSMGYAPKTSRTTADDLRLLAARQPLAECSTLDLHAFLAERSGEVAPATLAVTVRGCGRSTAGAARRSTATTRPLAALAEGAGDPGAVRHRAEHRRLLASIDGNDLLAVRDRALLCGAVGHRDAPLARSPAWHWATSTWPTAS